MTSQIDIHQAWDALPVDIRCQVQHLLFHTSVYPAIDYFLEARASYAMVAEQLNQWRWTFERAELENKEHWSLLIDAIELVFKPDMGQSRIREKLDRISAADSDFRLIYYLALSIQFDTPLNEVVIFQALVYQFVLNSRNVINPTGAGDLIIRTWQHILQVRGFFLRYPMQFRQILSGLSDKPGRREVAQVLLAAADSTGAKPSDELRALFSKLAVRE